MGGFFIWVNFLLANFKYERYPFVFTAWRNYKNL